jgi:hypothetical protein
MEASRNDGEKCVCLPWFRIRERSSFLKRPRFSDALHTFRLSEQDIVSTWFDRGDSVVPSQASLAVQQIPRGITFLEWRLKKAIA